MAELTDQIEIPDYQPPDTTFQERTPQFKPGTDYVKTEGLVENRVQNIMKSDNPLNQLARTQAKQMGQKRGLLNSASNVAAGVEGLTRNALNIALPDAQTYATALGRQQTADYQGLLNSQQAGYQFDNNLNQGAISAALKKVDNQFAEAMNRVNLNADLRKQISAQISDAGKTLQTNIEYIRRDPDLSAEAKESAITALVDQYHANMTSAAAMLGLDLTWD